MTVSPDSSISAARVAPSWRHQPRALSHRLGCRDIDRAFWLAVAGSNTASGNYAAREAPVRLLFFQILAKRSEPFISGGIGFKAKMLTRLERSLLRKEVNRHFGEPGGSWRIVSFAVCEMYDESCKDRCREALGSQRRPDTEGSVLEDLWQLYIAYDPKDAGRAIAIEMFDPYEPFDAPCVLKSYAITWTDTDSQSEVL